MSKVDSSNHETQEQYNKLGERVTRIEIYWKVTLILAIIFGVGSGIGTYFIKSYSDRIKDLRSQTDSLMANANRLKGIENDLNSYLNSQLTNVLDSVINHAPDVIRRAVDSTFLVYSKRINDAINDASDIIQKADAKFQVYSARVDRAHWRISNITLVNGNTLKIPPENQIMIRDALRVLPH